MVTTISAILIPCLKSFNQLLKQVEQPDYNRDAEVSSASWGDELGRLRVWAANIGAHQTGQSSLDFRLRDASHISNQITKLLCDLEKSLSDVFEELSEAEERVSEDDGTSATWPGDESTELQQLHEEITNIIDCLYQMSVLIRKPAQHDLLVASRMGDKSEFEFFDKEHVRNLHPRTEQQISQRLGCAITRRRKYLSYRERHHRKLEQGIEATQGIQRTATGSVISDTIATDFETPNIDFEETSSNSGMSLTSYAPSLVNGGRVTIPPPPKQSMGGKPFECPYCFYIIDIKGTKSWSRHVFKDIKPYLCTFPDCGLPDRLYDSRREWYFHETTEHHRKGFSCPLCKDDLKLSKQYERHVARHLEELALFALPRLEMDDAEDDDNDASKLSGQQEAMSEASQLDSGSLGYGEGDIVGLDVQSIIGSTDDMHEHSTDLGIPKSLETIPEDFLDRRSSEGRLADVDSNSGPEMVPYGSAANNYSKDDGKIASDLFLDQKADQRLQEATEATNVEATAKSPSPHQQPIKFKDAIGRRFNFPFDVVNTWGGMEYLIKEAFQHVADVGPHVADGHYDLIGPKDEIIMPSIWESVIQPGWEITMHLWPIPEPAEAKKEPRWKKVHQVGTGHRSEE